MSTAGASDQSQWFQQNAATFSGQLLFQEPLSRHTYYRIGGPARVLAFPKNVDDLSWLARGARESGLRLVILGAGSNVLISDEGLDALVVKTNRLGASDIHLVDRDRIRTGGGVAISTLLRRAAHEGWGGLEFLTGVPGCIGGAVRMNAGTHMGEVKDALTGVEAFVWEGDGEVRSYGSAEIRMEYRKNLFLPDRAVVIHAHWRIHPEEPAQVQARIDDTLARRKATQPIDYPSCGSVFKNPKESGLNAWQVIDRLGLRGHRIGGAQFAEKHCNFIINLGQARASDVAALIELAKRRAGSELGITLEEEVIYLQG